MLSPARGPVPPMPIARQTHVVTAIPILKGVQIAASLWILSVAPLLALGTRAAWNVEMTYLSLVE